MVKESCRMKKKLRVVMPRRKKSTSTIYKSKSKQPSLGSGQVVGPTLSTESYMRSKMEELRTSTAQVRLELERVWRTVTPPNASSGDDKCDLPMEALNERQEALEILFEAMEKDVDQIKQLMQLQLDSLRGIFNAIMLMGGLDTGNHGQSLENRHRFEIGKCSLSEAVAILQPKRSTVEYAMVSATALTGTILDPRASQTLNCVYCNTNFKKRSNFEKHGRTIPAYCAKQRARRDIHGNKLSKKKIGTLN